MKKLLLIFLLPAMIYSCSDNKTLSDGNKQSDSTVVNEQKNCEWRHKINWFEIPVTDFARAKKFYETILGIQIQEMSDTAMGGFTMGFLADLKDSTIVSGAIVKGQDYIPSDKGVIIYLNANPDLSVALAKVEQAGGKIVCPKMGIGENNEHGFMALFFDTEGNKLALHSVK